MTAPIVDLLKRIGKSNGHPSDRDVAMASIYASVLQQTPPQKKTQTRQVTERRRS